MKLTKRLRDTIHKEFMQEHTEYQDYFDDPDGTNDLANDVAIAICKRHGEDVDSDSFDPDTSPIHNYLIDELWSACKDEMDEMRE
jgi:hypothetical protein